MRFALTAVLAFAASAFAQKNPTDGFDPITNPTKDQNLESGQTFAITWQVADQYKDLKVDIELLGGADPEHLVPMSKIASGVDNAAGTYSWQIDGSLGKEAKYGISISNSANADVFQYSFPFNIKASGSATVTMTSAQGVKTIKLSSMTSTTTPMITTTSAVNTTTSITTTSCNTTSHNSTTSMRKPTSTPVVVITTSQQPAVTTSQTAPSSTPTDNAAANLGAGVMAALGGVAVALFAL